jgi:hypothetical protein
VSENRRHANTFTGQGTRSAVPDVVILAVEWRPRALLRAQLLEEGYEVVATDTWPDARRHLRPGAKPRLVIVDLEGLPSPQSVLDDLALLMKPDRVLVVSALATVSQDDVRKRGFHLLMRPTTIEAIVAEVRRIIGTAASMGNGEVRR